MRRLHLMGCIALAILCQVASAQAKDRTTVARAGEAPRAFPAISSTPPQKTGERTILRTYDEEQSRSLFAACDPDGDDRLDLFELRRALKDYGDPSDANWFRRLDTDRDGFVDWPEFDRFYGDLIRDGGTLRLWLTRSLPHREEPRPQMVAPTAPRRTIDLYDLDHNHELDLVEAAAMLRQLGVPPELLGMISVLDQNHSGTLEEAELAPVLQQFHIDLYGAPAPARPTAAATSAGLSEPWRAMDLDSNQRVDAHELGLALRRIDPQLERWTARVFAAVDRNRDGQLGSNELPGGAGSAAKVAEPAGKR